MLMLKFATGLFVVGALFGGTALKFVLRNKKAPKAIGWTHATLMLISLLLVISVSATGQNEVPIFSLIFLILAALGGITIFIMDIKRRPLPKIAVIIHPLIGLTGIISLLIFVINS